MSTTQALLPIRGGSPCTHPGTWQAETRSGDGTKRYGICCWCKQYVQGPVEASITGEPAEPPLQEPRSPRRERT